MLNLSDKELDRLSREAAEHYDPDTQQLSWDRFAPQLDKELGSPPPSSFSPSGFHFTPLLYTGTILLLAVSSYLFLKTPGNSGTLNKQVRQQATATQSKEQADQQNATAPAIQNNVDALPKPNPENNNTPAIPAAGNTKPHAPDEPALITDAPIRENKKAVAHPANNPSSNRILQATTRTAGPVASASTGTPRVLSKTKSVTGHTDVPDKQAGITDHTIPGNADFALSSPTGITTFNAKHHRKKSNGSGAAKNKIDTAIQPPEENNAGTAADKAPVETSANQPSESQTGRNASAGGNSNQQPANNGEGKNEEPSMPAFRPEWTDLSVASVSGNRPAVAVDDSVLSQAVQKNREDAEARIRNAGPKLQNNRSLVFALGFAPDLTTANSSPYYNKVSTNYSLLIGYYLLGNLSINSGLTITKKHYLLPDGQGFNPPNRWFNISGTCNMLEIPLTLRYDFNEGRKTNLFLNAGVSSYLMRSENYDYYYRVSPGYYTHGSKTIQTDKNYWVSVINLSAGIEQYLSKSLSLQIEPFIKLPVKGVGISNIQLSSYGLNFALRFSPLLKQSRR